MGAGHSHNHDHSGAFRWSVGLNMIIVVSELAGGFWSNSLALIADAGHNFADVLGLILAWVATRLASRRTSERYTYGWKRASVLAALANGILLLAGTVGLFWEAIERLRAGTPPPSQPQVIMAIALLGTVINAWTASMFSHHHGDVNLRGAFLHLIADAMVGVGVIVSAAVVWATGWEQVDPLTSILISVTILWGTWGLLMESLALSLDAVPKNIELGEVEQFLRSLPGVTDVHDLHVWSLSTDQTALTAHLVRPGAGLDDEFLRTTEDELKSRFSIVHSTLQVEENPHVGCSEGQAPAGSKGAG